MYKIYAYPAGNTANRQLLYEPGNRTAIVLSPKLTREVSKAGSLYFTMDRSHPLYDSLPKMRTVVSVMQDGHESWRGRILNHEADWYNRRVVYCEGALAFLNDSCLTPFNFEGTLREFLQHLLEAHNSMVRDPLKCFELGTVTAALGDLRVHFGDADQYGVGEDYGSTWDILSKMVLKIFGGYVYCTYNDSTGYNVLNYCDQNFEASRQTAQKIEYGVNLLDLTEKTDSNSLFTCVFPMGNKHTVTETKWYWKILWWGKSYTESHEECYGITDTDSATINKYLPAGFEYDLQKGYIQSTEAIQKFGYICKDRQYDTDSDNATFAAAVQDLQQNRMMSSTYTVKAVDLVDAGYDTQRLDFACFAQIVSSPHSVDATMLCTKLVEPLDNPSKKEFSFGMTRKTLTDRQVAALGRTNLLDEDAAAARGYASNILDLLNKYKKKNDDKVKSVEDIAKNAQSAADEAAKTATNYLSFDRNTGLTVGHETLPGKKVVISNEAVKVISGTAMVNITAGGIEITDGAGSCTISSGDITFRGIRNKQELWYNSEMTFAAQTIRPKNLEIYSALLILFRSQKSGTWFSGGGNAGLVSLIVPVNGVEMSMVYPWNTVHKRTVTAYSDRIEFGTGYERTSTYTTGISGYATFFGLESPTGDGWNQSDGMCVPYKIYGFM